jgi:hypothetical protein
LETIRPETEGKEEGEEQGTTLTAGSSTVTPCKKNTTEFSCNRKRLLLMRVPSLLSLIIRRH